jgi:hypothetical protein
LFTVYRIDKQCGKNIKKLWEIVKKQNSHGFSTAAQNENYGEGADLCGTKEKREKNERMISMVKKANAFFFPGSSFLFPLLLFS